MALYPDMTGITSFEDFLRYDNAVTGGLATPLMVFTIFLVVLGVTSAYLKNKSLVVASFFSTFSSIYLWLNGLLSWTYLAVCITALVISTILLIRESG
ncbi:MAG: hypothetical protein NT130_03450 [Candidatus Micrarchaeota archaeon]|nr:hypothetical protein [Candidatus Micrarchaeota archaeon]